MILSVDDLSVADVGNLWWLGIRTVDGAIPGSTLALSGLAAEDLVDVTTGVLKPEQAYFVVLHDLGRKLRSTVEMTSEVDSDSVIKQWWVDGAQPARLIRVHRQVNKEYMLSLSNDDLQDIAQWKIAIPSLSLGVACADNSGRIIVGGLEDRLVYAQNSITVEHLDGADFPDGLRLIDNSSGCKAVMLDIQDNDSDVNGVGIIDLADNSLISEFRARKDTKLTLFADGKRLLQQDILYEPVENSGGYRAHPTANFRILDSDTGRIIKEAKLVAGDTSPLFCAGHDEKVVISVDGMMHLVSLDTLSIIASQHIPLKRYLVM